MEHSERVLLVFLDGVGLGPSDPAINPIAAANLPTFERLLGGLRPVADAVGSRRSPQRAAAGFLVPLDATLDMPGLPQSGTGQSSLLTGENTARAFGRHAGPWIPTALRASLRDGSVLARTRAAGGRVAFANAYPEELFEGGRPRGPVVRAGPPLAALGADVLTRHTPELAAGQAVASEIVNDGWRERLGRTELPAVTAAQAGANLARLAGAHDLTLFAHYTTDLVGHRGTFGECVEAVERVDAFLGGLVDALPSGTTLVVASDHGNLEDARGGHTRNPALGLVVGPGARTLASRMRSLLDVAPALLERYVS